MSTVVGELFEWGGVLVFLYCLLLLFCFLEQSLSCLFVHSEEKERKKKKYNIITNKTKGTYVYVGSRLCGLRKHNGKLFTRKKGEEDERVLEALWR